MGRNCASSLVFKRQSAQCIKEGKISNTNMLIIPLLSQLLPRHQCTDEMKRLFYDEIGKSPLGQSQSKQYGHLSFSCLVMKIMNWYLIVFGSCFKNQTELLPDNTTTHCIPPRHSTLLNYHLCSPGYANTFLWRLRFWFPQRR